MAVERQRQLAVSLAVPSVDVSWGNISRKQSKPSEIPEFCDAHDVFFDFSRNTF